jgi:chromosome segregation ATPase
MTATFPEELILEKISHLTSRMEKAEENIKELDTRMDQFDNFMTRIETLFDGMEKKFSSLEVKIDKFIERQDLKEQRMQEQERSGMSQALMKTLEIVGIIVAAIAAGKLL